MTKDYQQVNRDAWAYLARAGCEASVPFGPAHFERARELLDPENLLPWDEVHSVLCLACGGGQQGPLFASLGIRVTVADLSPAQLERDRETAHRYGLPIECVEADMLDLACLHGRDFDLVYQPISACYVPDVSRLYAEVRSTLRAGGCYRVEHWNPFHAQLAQPDPWDGSAYRIAYPQGDGEPVPWHAYQEGTGEIAATCWHFIHSMDQLIGGLCDQGFHILHFREVATADSRAPPAEAAHVSAYLPPRFVLVGRRVS